MLKILFFGIGFFISLFCYTNFHSMIVCGLPCASVLMKCGAVTEEKKKSFIILNVFTTLFNAIVCLGALICVALFFKDNLLAYLVGSVIAVIIWFFRKDALIPGQVKEYLQSKIRFISIPESLPALNFGLKRQLIYETFCNFCLNEFTSQQSSPLFSYTDEQIQSYTQRCSSAFLILKDFNNGEFRNVSLKSNQLLVEYILNTIPLCIGWGIFHANQEKKQKAITESNRFLENLESDAPEELKVGIVGMRSVYNSLYKRMVKYKKENIDPKYLEDNSKENYEILITDFLKYICKIYPKIQWYDGIVEDFKHCMDE